MFAPPPTATLSRAEIQAKRAQLQAKRASSTGGSSISSASELKLSDSTTQQQAPPKIKKAGRFGGNNGGGVEEIRETDKEAWKFKKPKLGLGGSKKGRSTTLQDGGGSGVSLPATLLPPPPPPPPGPPSLRSDAGSFVDSIVEGPTSPSERSRDKATPPKRPARPSGEMFLSPPLAAAMSDSFPRALTPESFAGSSFRSANSASPVTPPPFQAPLSVRGAFPTMPSTGSPGPPPPLPSPPIPNPSMLSSPPTLTGPLSPPPSTPPPPIPERSPLRQQRTTRPNSNPTTSTAPMADASRKQQAMSSDAALSSAMAELRMAMKDPIAIGQGEQPIPPRRLWAAPKPSGPSVLTGIHPLQIRKAGKSPAKSLSRSGTGSSKAVAATAGEKSSPVASQAKPIVAVGRAQRIAKQGLRRQVHVIHRKGNSGPSVKSAAAAAAGQKKPKTPIVAPRPRKGDGETLAMLQTSDFFPGGSNEIHHSSIDIPAAARFVDRDLPDTPNSIAPTPTELYHPSHAPFGEVRKGGTSGGSVLRSPLSIVSDTSAKSNSSPAPQSPPSVVSDGLPHRLATIQEYKSLSENSPPASGTATPVQTQIHLRGGSVVTVTPPELTAWQRSIYIHGPIQLPKPVILPRKNSVASMEPFQEAIDRVYQDALFVPRRRSDDAVVDDVCEFFDEFGFEDIGFEGGLLAVEQAAGAFDEHDAMDVDELDEPVERFTTPPGFLPAGDISPVERLVAQDVVEASMSKPILSPIILEPNVRLPPVENEETLRARGIARLSQQSNGRSSTSSRSSSYRKDKPILSRRTSGSVSPAVSDGQNSMLPLLPAPQPSMLDSVMEASRDEESDWVEEMVQDGDAGGMDWSDDDLEETDAGASWTAPAVKQKKHGLDRGFGKESRNPVAKMRRFVATATTIL